MQLSFAAEFRLYVKLERCIINTFMDFHGIKQIYEVIFIKKLTDRGEPKRKS